MSSEDNDSDVSILSSEMIEQPPSPPHEPEIFYWPPCGACRVLRRRCKVTCDFAPYFPHGQHQKFDMVHKVFGGRNAAKLLRQVHPSVRQATANSLVVEASMRLVDPINGAVGLVNALQNQLRSSQARIHEMQVEFHRFRLAAEQQLANAAAAAAADPNQVVMEPGNASGAMGAPQNDENANPADGRQ